MGTILVPLFAHYRSPSPTVQAALAGGLANLPDEGALRFGHRQRAAEVIGEGHDEVSVPPCLCASAVNCGNQLATVRDAAAKRQRPLDDGEAFGQSGSANSGCCPYVVPNE